MPDLLSPGSEIAGRYIVQDYCNSGGQSFSFIGEDKRADRPWKKKVFLKQYLDVPPGSPEARQMPGHFRRFRQRLADDHNYLCLPEDIIETHNSIVAVFRFLPGKDLQSLMMEGLDDAQCTRFAIAIANAVRIIHKVGIVHLDLKPDNIIIKHDEKRGQDFVHLIDLDAATIDGEALRPDLIGTPMYMSPEHMNSRDFGEPSEKSDVFTLGIILFQILFGRHPFDGVEDYADAVFERDMSVPENDYHKDVVRRVVSCLAPDPARRPKSGWVHSTLHSHYRTGFLAERSSDRWVSRGRLKDFEDEPDEAPERPKPAKNVADTFVELSSLRNRRFRRRYVRNQKITSDDFRGSGAKNLPTNVFSLFIERGNWALKALDSRCDLLVDGRSLGRGDTAFLAHGSKVSVNGEQFLVSMREAVRHSDGPDMVITAERDRPKTEDPHELPFLVRLFSRLRR